MSEIKDKCPKCGSKNSLDFEGQYYDGFWDRYFTRYVCVKCGERVESRN